MRRPSRSGLARPYIWRLSSLMRLTCPSTLPELQVVKERLGHASIVTTERYLHSLPTADETALDALARIRGPQLVRPA